MNGDYGVKRQLEQVAQLLRLQVPTHAETLPLRSHSRPPLADEGGRQVTRRTTGGNVRHHATRDLWEARYVGADGRRHSVYAKTERGAQEALRKALVDADHGIRPVSRQLTVAAALDDWLVSQQHKLRPRTAASYADTTRLYILPAIGRIPLAKLQPEHIDRMLASLSEGGSLSPTTVRYVYSVLRTGLGHALRQGKIVRNVATLVDPPAKAHREQQPLSVEQVRTFLAGVHGDGREALYLTALGTGLRQGELLALRWQDADLATGTLTVRNTLQRFTRQLAAPKTESSRRSLRLPQSVVVALAGHRERQAVVPLNGLIFTTLAGAPLDSANVTRSLQRTLRRLGLPRQRFHDLRHAFATLALEAGEDLHAVSRALGHTTIATTADVYAHVTPAMQERLAQRMDVILGG
jgi:integrase